MDEAATRRVNVPEALTSLRDEPDCRCSEAQKFLLWKLQLSDIKAEIKAELQADMTSHLGQTSKRLQVLEENMQGVSENVKRLDDVVSRLESRLQKAQVDSVTTGSQPPAHTDDASSQAKATDDTPAGPLPAYVAIETITRQLDTLIDKYQTVQPLVSKLEVKVDRLEAKADHSDVKLFRLDEKYDHTEAFVTRSRELSTKALDRLRTNMLAKITELENHRTETTVHISRLNGVMKAQEAFEAKLVGIVQDLDSHKEKQAKETLERDINWATVIVEHDQTVTKLEVAEKQIKEIKKKQETVISGHAQTVTKLGTAEKHIKEIKKKQEAVISGHAQTAAKLGTAEMQIKEFRKKQDAAISGHAQTAAKLGTAEKDIKELKKKQAANTQECMRLEGIIKGQNKTGASQKGPVGEEKDQTKTDEASKLTKAKVEVLSNDLQDLRKMTLTFIHQTHMRAINGRLLKASRPARPVPSMSAGLAPVGISAFTPKGWVLADPQSVGSEPLNVVDSWLNMYDIGDHAIPTMKDVPLNTKILILREFVGEEIL